MTPMAATHLTPRLLRGAVAFGVGVYAFMHGFVLPLSAIPFKMTYSASVLLQGLAVHVFLVAFPIALCVRRASLPRKRDQPAPRQSS